VLGGLLRTTNGSKLLNMKTIAISIDAETLRRLDRIAGASRPRAPSKRRRPNRSEIVRLALTEYVANRERQDREERDRRALAGGSARLRREEEALVAEQAKL